MIHTRSQVVGRENRPGWQLKSLATAIALVAAAGAHAQGASKGPALDAAVAESIAKFGLAVVVGSGELIGSSAKPSMPAEDAQLLGDDVNKLVGDYQRQATAARFAGSLVQTNGEVIITSAQVLATASGVGALPAAAVAAAARYGNEKFASFIAQEGVDRATGMLSAGLQDMSASDRRRFDALLQKNDYIGAANLFDKRTKKLTRVSTLLKDDPAAAEASKKLMIETMKETTSAALITAGKAYAKSQTLEKDLAAHVKTTREFSRQMATKMETLERSSQELGQQIAGVRTDLEALKTSTQANAYQLSVVQDILFDQQSPAAKLALLRSGAKPDLKGSERTTVEKYLELEIKKQKILDTASTVVRAAADVNTILTNFGFKDKALNDAVSYGMVATNALSQAFSGNYLGAIATVSGLFGKGQKDPNQAKFERVFAELAQIQRKLDAVIELQKKTLQAIEDLSKQLAQVETRLHERLDNVEFELKVLNSAVSVQLWSSFQPCMTSWDKRDAQPGYRFDDETLRFTSVVGMEAYTRDWAAAHVFACAKTLRDSFSHLRSSADFGSPLRLEFAIARQLGAPPPSETKAYSPPELKAYLSDVHGPAAKLGLQSWQARRETKAGWGSSAGLFALLSSPSSTASTLLERVRKLDARSPATALTGCGPVSLLGERAKTLMCSDSGSFDQAQDGNNEDRARDRTQTFLQDAIVRSQVEHLVKWSALVSGPSNLAPGGSAVAAPLSVNELATAQGPGANRFAYGRDILFGTLSITDIAIAQQAMVYGDLTAYFIYNELWDATQFKFRPATTERQKLADTLLRNPNNPWLRQNVGMLVLMQAERACGQRACASSELGYRAMLSPLSGRQTSADGTSQPVAATDERRDHARQLVLGQFRFDDSLEVLVRDIGTLRQYVLKTAGYELPVPPAAIWASKELVYPPAMMARIRERETLAQRWAEYAALDNWDPKQTVRVVRAIADGDGR